MIFQFYFIDEIVLMELCMQKSVVSVLDYVRFRVAQPNLFNYCLFIKQIHEFFQELQFLLNQTN